MIRKNDEEGIKKTPQLIHHLRKRVVQSSKRIKMIKFSKYTLISCSDLSPSARSLSQDHIYLKLKSSNLTEFKS